MRFVNEVIKIKLIEFNNLKYIQFDNINNTGIVNHFFSTRQGGVSKDDFYSMNLSFTRGDERENVIRNFEIMEEVTKINYKNIVMCKQSHSNNVYIVKESDVGSGVLKESNINNIDALITNIKNIPISIFSADCVPIYFVDKIKHIIAVAHSGWRGTLNSISKNVIETMIENFEVNPKDIVCAIGPSIGKCCFQVGKEVIEEFRKKFVNIDDYIFIDKDFNKYKLDLWSINSDIIESCGVLKKNIEIANLCTMCNSELFYSHRLMGNNRGSMIAVIELI